MSPRCVSSFLVIKSREMSLDMKPISGQVQVISLASSTDREGDNRSLFAMLQQYTRHSFEPLVRINGQASQVNNIPLFIIIYKTSLLYNLGYSRDLIRMNWRI